LSFPKQKFKENFLNFDFWQSVSTNLQSLLKSDEAITPKKKVEKICNKKGKCDNDVEIYVSGLPSIGVALHKVG
jgi:hypothetical protein